MTGQGLDVLEQTVAQEFPLPEAQEGTLLTNNRQSEAVGRALKAVCSARQALEAGLTPDAVLTDVEEALAALGELIGKTVVKIWWTRFFPLLRGKMSCASCLGEEV